MPDLNPSLSVLVFLWLANLSWQDLKSRQVTHAAWIFIPLLIAAVWQAISGSWSLALLSGLVILMSERSRLPVRWRALVIPSGVPLTGILLFAGGLEWILVSLAVIGFWLAWELGVWGGVDALVAITLLLLWPEPALLYGILLANLLTALAAWGVDLCRRGWVGGLHRLPGMPVLALAVVIFALLERL